jgi:hypothetical protein
MLPMNVNLLIDAIVRQTTVLIAQLATSAGNRAPLAHTANQVFLSLVRELKRQGLGNNVIADMFGLALRTYHDKVQRLSESQTYRGRSLWEAVLSFIQERQEVSRPEVLQRFRNDDERVVRSVLTDLVESNLLFHSGKGDLSTYRAAPLVAGNVETEAALDATTQLLWVVVHRFGPLTVAELSAHVPVAAAMLKQALEVLLKENKVVAEGEGALCRYRAQHCVIPVGDAAGWEAAVFDHYQAMVTAICTKLSAGERRATSGETIGGSTYTYDVWVGHPLEAEVAGHLQRMREQSVALRQRVEAYNAAQGAQSTGAPKKFISYVGQTVIEHEQEEI